MPPSTAAAQTIQLAASLSFPQRQLLWLLSLLAGGLLVWSKRGVAPGAPRLVPALPLLALNLLTPLMFNGDSEVITNISTFIATAAVTNFKVRSGIACPHGQATGGYAWRIASLAPCAAVHSASLHQAAGGLW